MRYLHRCFFGSRPRTLLLLRHLGTKFLFLYGNAVLFGNQLRQHQRKAVGIVKQKGIFARKFIRTEALFQQSHAFIQSLSKESFFDFQRFTDGFVF